MSLSRGRNRPFLRLLTRPLLRPLLRPQQAATQPAWAWAWLLALALLGVQGLGLWHRVAHAVPGAAASMVVDGSRSAADGASAFGHAAGDDAQCRLYDSIGSACAPWAAADTALPPRVATAPAAVTPTPSAARPLRPYQVRGPPWA